MWLDQRVNESERKQEIQKQGEPDINGLDG